MGFDLADQLEASVALDNGSWGPGVNHVRAWRLAQHEDAEWVCVVEDDAILCSEFHRHAIEALSATQTNVVSFYLGTNYPTHLARKARSAVLEAERVGKRWVNLATLNHAVCVAVRAEYVDLMLERVVKSNQAIDDAISEWAQMRRFQVGYPIPSLVDHRDEPTLIENRTDSVIRAKPRRAIRFLG